MKGGYSCQIDKDSFKGLTSLYSGTFALALINYLGLPLTVLVMIMSV